VADEDAGRFRSSRGRADLNPYVDKLAEYAPWAMTSDQGEAARGQWRALMGLPQTAPLILEVGPGNGFFFREMCARHSTAGLIGIEVRFKRVWLTARKAVQEGHRHFRVLHHHASHLSELFAEGELDAVHANHPDPWPKDRHHKHRLLQAPFRERLEVILKPGGEFWIKSDFAPYGPLACDLFDVPGWERMSFTADLHGAPLEPPPQARFWGGDIETNYERKSRANGAIILLAGFVRRS
jgi:tRNA (guanine-N7-)-methyltransferase